MAAFFNNYPNYGPDKLPQLWDLSPLLMVYVMAQIILQLLYVVAKTDWHRRDRTAAHTISSEA